MFWKATSEAGVLRICNFLHAHGEIDSATCQDLDCVFLFRIDLGEESFKIEAHNIGLR